MVERRIVDFKDSDDGVEGATIAHMTKFRIFGVVGRRALRLGNSDDLSHGNIEELGQWIDKAADQPWARDAVDLGMLAGDPLVFDRAKVLARRQPGCSP